MKKILKEVKPFSFIIVIIISFVASGIFLYFLDDLGYFAWIFKCYGKTLELIFNIQDVTFAKLWKTMLSDVAVISSGLLALFTVFDWIPTWVMNVLGYKNGNRQREAVGDV